MTSFAVTLPNKVQIDPILGKKCKHRNLLRCPVGDASILECCIFGGFNLLLHLKFVCLLVHSVLMYHIMSSTSRVLSLATCMTNYD
jgi:hypothetical protein